MTSCSARRPGPINGRPQDPTRRPPRCSPLEAHPRSATPRKTSNQEPQRPATRRTTTTSRDQWPPGPRSAPPPAFGLSPLKARHHNAGDAFRWSVAETPLISITTGAPRRTAPPPDARHRSLRRCSAARRGAARMDYAAGPSDVSVGAFCRPARFAPYLSRRTPASAHQRMTLIS